MAHKGTVPWNKGLTKETDIRVLKNTNSKKGKGGESTKLRHERNRKEKLGDDYWLLDHPEQWKINCSRCKNKHIIYIRFASFYRSLNKIRQGLIVNCNSCQNIGIQFSEETKRNQSIAAKNRKINPINDSIRKQKIQEFQRNRYQNFTEDQRQDLYNKQQLGYINMDPNKKKDQYNKISKKRKEEMLRLGTSDIFKPSYNVSTIEYIETKLNSEYNTKFMHAENGGEFKIYDKVNQKFYYADAYSKELNLWIEFDEVGKFKNNKLKDEHIIREDSIRKLLNCNIIRIKV